MQFSKWVTLGFGALCLVAVAGVLGAQHLYYMAAILLTLPGVSYALGWFTLRGLRFDRELPMAAWEGEETSILYAIENPTRVPRFFISAQEPLPEWIEPLEPEPPLFNAAPNETTRVAHIVRFRKRGYYQVNAFSVTAMDPLGVFAFSAQVPAEGELVVYPTPRQMNAMPLSGAERYGWQEFTALALRGSSVDPDGVRLYHPGDPLRRIHWRQTARTGRLSVIEFEENQSLNLILALDARQGTEVGSGAETTLEYGVRFAASAAYLAIQQGANVRLIVDRPTDDDVALAPLSALSGRGEEHLFAILDTLARVEATATQPIGTVIQHNLGTLMAGTTLCVITSSPDDALLEVLTYYTAVGVHVLAVYVDPNTFGATKISPAERTAFLERLAGAKAHTFLVSRHEDGELYPEAMTYATL